VTIRILAIQILTERPWPFTARNKAAISSFLPGTSARRTAVTVGEQLPIERPRAKFSDDTCDTSGARQIPSDQPGTRRFEHPLSLAPQFSGLRFYTFPGGCATYRFSFAQGTSPALAVAVDNALAFQSRSTLVNYVRHTEGLMLCGRGAACPR
jgi:hypothetical protein